MPKIANYSVEMTDKIISQYQNGTSVDEIATSIGKSVRSVRSKLVREGVYIPQEKKTSKKVQEPTKKELLAANKSNDEICDVRPRHMKFMLQKII